MYNDNDLEEAVAAGVIARESVDAFRLRIADARHLPRVDEEHYRVFDGSNDGFVTVASILLMAGLGNLGWLTNHIVAGVAVAGAAWGLAEYFVRIRRLTLTGIVLSFAFFGGVIATMVLALIAAEPNWGSSGFVATGAVIAAVTAVATWLFWRRFGVPIAMSFVALATAGVVIALAMAVLGHAGPILYAIALICGLGVFAYAMWWDLSDSTRVTQRHEVAFWIHGVAGSLIAQPIFYLIGATGMSFFFVTTGQTVTVLVLYAVFAVVALAIDRRALLASGIGSLLYALAGIFMHAGAYNAALGCAALIAGSVLLLLSAFWHPARRAIMPLLGSLADRLPPVGDRAEEAEY